ncbi:MAG: redoxin domain-containing protein [Patescibacteria group bacterium]
MTRSTQIALAFVGVLIVASLIILSRGPGVVMSPNASSTPAIVSVSDMGGTSSSLPVYDVTMPEFQGITNWWNTPEHEPLTPASLKGKVVLVDFWTYSCINCIRTYPFLKSMQEKYADKGLVIIGVHTPEFEFEKNPDNVAKEIEKNELKYPIALDPNYGTWNAYANHYWPAGYLFDQQGRLRRVHFGEGEYDESEAAIRSLLEEGGGALAAEQATDMNQPDFSKIKTEETYFGLSRGEAFMGSTGPKDQDVMFSSQTVTSNKWSVEGNWRFTEEYVQANSSGASFRFKVQANKMHLVLESADGKDKTIEIYVDGKKTGEMTINMSTLYDIATFPDAGEHTVEVRMKDGGVRFYAATFS